MTDIPLTFARLHEVNVARCSQWHPGFPKVSHDWVGTDWSNAMAGEMGETCNVVKKLRRIDVGLPGSKDPELHVLLADLGEEIADTLVYLDLVRAFHGIKPPAGSFHDLTLSLQPKSRTGAFWANQCIVQVGRVCQQVAEAETAGEFTPVHEAILRVRLDLTNETIGALASFYDIDLSAAVTGKFNAVSEREGFPHRL